MKNVIIIGIVLLAGRIQAQSIVGTWQVTDEKTCFESQLPESDTEKELLKDMNASSQTSVAKLMHFDKKGNGDEAVFSKGMKKGTGKNEFKYKVSGGQLMLMDAKSGIMTMQLVIDELSETTLRIHDAARDCETKTFLRIK